MLQATMVVDNAYGWRPVFCYGACFWLGEVGGFGESSVVGIVSVRRGAYIL